jgi:hyaluronoglucosaminidase
MLKLPGYIKDVYFMNSFIKFTGCTRLPVAMTSRTVTYQMFSDFDQMLDVSKIAFKGENPVLLHIAFNRNLKEDGYSLEILKARAIYVEASSRRGVRYALALLGQLVQVIGNDVYLPIIRIDDEPSFRYRGIIEGFYGKPWSHEERLDEVDFMNKYRMNAFMYAPKDDIYHRKLWRELYPADDLKRLLEIKAKCDSLDIDFYYCISPGNDFNYCDEHEFKALFAKLDQVMENGVRYFGLLMDDIDYKLKGATKDRFTRPGIAHAYICNKVNSYLKEHLIDYRLIMCPTEYHQNDDNLYRYDLDTMMDKNIAVFFTGDAVCAEVITESIAASVHEDFNHPQYIWENHPVNDYLPSRLFTGPIRNRSRRMPEHVDGYITNPMNQWQMSKVGVASCAMYAWNAEGYDEEKAYLEGLSNYEGLFDEIKTFCDANRSTVVDHYDNFDFEQLVKQENYEEILAYYQKLSSAAASLMKENLPVIAEIKPWLERCLMETELVKDIIDGNVGHDELVEKLKCPQLLGIECLDYLIREKKLLGDAEYQEFVTKRRGSGWWRVWEDKR